MKTICRVGNMLGNLSRESFMALGSFPGVKTIIMKVMHIALARSKITLKKIFHHPNTKKCSFLCNKRGSKKFFPIFLLLGLVQGPPKYIPSKKIEIFEGAP